MNKAALGKIGRLLGLAADVRIVLQKMFSILSEEKSRSHLLQSLSVESITAVDIDGAPNVSNVVGNEWPAVEEEEGLPPRTSLSCSQSLCKLVPGDGGRLLHHHRPLHRHRL